MNKEEARKIVLVKFSKVDDANNSDEVHTDVEESEEDSGEDSSDDSVNNDGGNI